MRRLTYGIGINDFKYTVMYDEKNKIQEYVIWNEMLRRCYSEKFQTKYPSYKGCCVEEFFHSFTNFYNYIHTLKGYDLGYQLDKDLLIKNNKVYSRQTVCFIPKELNLFMTKRNVCRSADLPIGVRFINNRYKSEITIDNKSIFLGYYNTPVEAFNVYKEAKENQAKVLAERWKDKIDERAYNALMNYKVEITD